MAYYNFFRSQDMFQNVPFRFRGGGMPPMPAGRNVSITQNINIKNGPSGFWGFMGGLTQGLFGGGNMGGCSIFSNMGMPSFNNFGMMGNIGMMSPFGNIFGVLNNATTQQAKPQGDDTDASIANMKTLYGKHGLKVIYDKASKQFVATDDNSDKDPIPTASTSKEMIDILNKRYEKQSNNTDVQKPDTDKPDNDGKTTKHEDKSGVKADDVKGNIIIADHVNNTSVTGETKFGTKNKEGWYDTITVGGHKCTFVEVKNGIASYKADGDGQIYQLRWHGDAIELNQYEGDAGAGKANWHNKK